MSGAQFRYKREKKLEYRKKMAGSLQKFLNIQENTETSTTAESEVLDDASQPTTSVRMELMEECEISTTENSPINNSSGTDSVANLENIPGPSTGTLLQNDVGMWPKNITSDVVKILVERGPIKVINFDYPSNADGRKFSEKYYNRQLPNGEEIIRDWLLYSISNDSVFCFCCKIFGKSQTSLSDLVGFSDWRHLSLTLRRHETSINHNENIKSWINLNSILKTNTAINHIQLRLLDVEKKHWYEVIERIIAIIQYLSRQCLAFRGKSNKLFEYNNGNFLKAVEIISKFDPVMREHVRRIQHVQDKQKHFVHYLGDQIQNEIIDLLGSAIKTNILNMIRKSKYFSIILDCTPDVSHKEQITIVIRFVLMNNASKKVEVREHFIGFCPITNSTGEGLCQFLVELLSKLNLNINNLRGQGYDNGANMRGKHSGVQKRILELNNRAFFIPCSAHSLNLVVNDAAKCSHETINFFDIIQEFYVFFSASTKRWAIFEKQVPELKLKPLSDTRWSSRIDAIKPLRYNLCNIFDALVEISTDSSLDLNVSHKANSLALKIQNYKFVCSIIIWHNILFKINTLSKMMQSSTMNVQVCLDYLNNLLEYFTKLRSDNGFNDILVDANEIALELNIDACFPLPQTLRPRKKPKMFDYEQNDDVILDPKINFKVELFYRILDQTLSSLRSRFEELQTFNDIFGFLTKMGSHSDEDLLKYCKDLHLKLQDQSREESDIDGIDLFNEIKAFRLHSTTQTLNDPQIILQYIFENDLISTFPNVTIALRIFLTLPVSVASGERSFSKLKIIKKYLRSTMVQQRLSNLAIISIEHEILDTLNMHQTISEFAALKARKVQFL